MIFSIYTEIIPLNSSNQLNFVMDLPSFLWGTVWILKYLDELVLNLMQSFHISVYYWYIWS